MYSVILVTSPPKYAEKIAIMLVEKKMAACVSITQVRSIYRWQNKIEKERESLLIIKTKMKLFEEVQKAIKQVHPYSVPEIVCLEIKEGNKEYLDWIEDSVVLEKG
jgi:periplasmic divalent cation tolerance protein